MTTDATDKYIIRRLGEIETECGVCGWRKTLVTHDDTPVANVSHLTIDDSKYHYHREMTEFYYVLTGGDLVRERPDAWTAERAPTAYETNVPGMYAVGDVRARSVKRVAGAVGEGSVVIQQVTQYLAERG